MVTVKKLETLFVDNWHECIGGIKMFSSKLVVVLAMGKSAKEKLESLGKLDRNQFNYKFERLSEAQEIARSLNFVKTSNFLII